MKKTFAVAVTLSFLLLSTIVGTNTNSTKANFNPFHATLSTDPPAFTLKPSTKHIWIGDDQIGFEIAKPSSWFEGWIAGEICSINYSIDQKLFSIDVGIVEINTGGVVYTTDNLPETSFHSINLTGLTDGQHVIEIRITAANFYTIEGDYWTIHEYAMLVTERIEFSTEAVNGTTSYIINSVVEKVYPDKAPPGISILSPKKQAYYSNVSLSFTTDEDPSWMGYRVDNQANVTLTENITLSNLIDGTHRLVIYANDTAGNMGKSEAVFFTVQTAEKGGYYGVGSDTVVIVVGLLVVAGMTGVGVALRARRW